MMSSDKAESTERREGEQRGEGNKRGGGGWRAVQDQNILQQSFDVKGQGCRGVRRCCAATLAGFCFDMLQHAATGQLSSQPASARPPGSLEEARVNTSAGYLDGGVLGGCDHDGEDGVEDDTRDGSTVAAQGVSLRGAGDPLLGVPLLTHRASVRHLLLRLIQLRLQLHDLRHKGIKD